MRWIAVLSLLGLSAPAIAAEPVYFPSAHAGAPLSEAVQVGEMLYVSPVLGLRPGTVVLADGGLEGQTAAAMDQIGRTLAARQLSYDNVVRCELNVVNAADGARMAIVNRVYITYFKNGRFPARALNSPANLPLNAELSIECWAHIPQK
jgi:2-iminobutanoate/2-iminopropanoate deaminase